MNAIEPPNEIQEFSLVKGGLVYELFCRTGLCNQDLEPPLRRALVVASIVWLPLLGLTVLGGRFNGGVNIPFLSDVENHVRFLVSLPLLLVGETYVRRLLSPRIRNFVARKIIREVDMPKFRAAIESAHRMRDLVVIELMLFVFVIAVGAWFYGGVLASASHSIPYLVRDPGRDRMEFYDRRILDDLRQSAGPGPMVAACLRRGRAFYPTISGIRSMRYLTSFAR